MPYINDRKVSEEEYQAALKAAGTPKDDRIIYIAVRWRDQGLFVEGGFNQEFEFLDKGKREFVLQMALEAVLANGVAMFPDDQDWMDTLREHTSLGAAGGPNWRTQPPTPHTEGATHGDHDQAAGIDRAGESTSPDQGDRTE